MEALAGASAHAPYLREDASSFLRRFVRMMFRDGDLAKPNSFEHFNPITGQASFYRALDEVQRSWIADQIVSYVMGIRPHEGGITIDPFPFALERAEITGVHTRGRKVTVRITGERVHATVDDRPFDTVLGEPLEIPDAEPD